jgi:hypothetical protein
VAYTRHAHYVPDPRNDVCGWLEERKRKSQ